MNDYSRYLKVGDTFTLAGSDGYYFHMGIENALSEGLLVKCVVTARVKGTGIAFITKNITEERMGVILDSSPSFVRVLIGKESTEVVSL